MNYYLYFFFFGMTCILYKTYDHKTYNPFRLYSKYKFKNQLIEFFNEHNKSKITQVDKIVDKYIDNPKYLMNILLEKYKKIKK